MAATIYKGLDSYIIFAEDTAFGTPGPPAANATLGIVQSFTGTITNNMMRVQGLGVSRNAIDSVNGGLDVTGSMEWQLQVFTPLQYMIGGELTGDETDGSVAEVNSMGYAASECPTLTLEVGSEGGSNDDVMTYDGIIVNTFNMTATQGEIVVCTADWIGRQATSSTSIETYVASSARPFTFVDGAVSIGSDAVSEVVSFALTCANNVFTYRALGSRLIQAPVYGIRRYDFTITMKKTYDAGANILSGTEMRSLVMDGATGTECADTAAWASVGNVKLVLSEGAVAGDRTLTAELTECKIESWSAPIDLGGGVVEITAAGFGLAGAAGNIFVWATTA